MRTDAPLIVEAHPENYNGYKFITLIRFNDQDILVIVDNLINKQLSAYVLDFCQVSGVSEEKIISITEDWYLSGNHKKYPISVQFSKMGLTDEMSKVLRNYSVDYISRVIGTLPIYKMTGTYKVKKRRRKALPRSMEYVDRRRKINQSN